MTGGDLFKNIYRIVRKIPKGKVATYGQLAKMVGTRDARKIGWALHANRDSDCPCHRVVSKDGRLAPNFAFSAKSDKSRILGGPATSRSSRRIRTEPRSREVSLGGDGEKEQKRRLESEGVSFINGSHVDLEKHQWMPK